MPVHQTCLDRQARLLELIPFQSAGDYPSSTRLLARMTDVYTGTYSAQRRRLERDLKDLLDSGQIRVTNPAVTPRCFQRIAQESAADPHLLDYIRALSDALVKERLPSRCHEAMWLRLRDAHHRPLLPEGRFRAISDNQRLLPAAIKPSVLAAVLAALVQRQALRVGYRKPDAGLQRLLLHPQGLLQRGPMLYLYALKDDENLVKMFALHRMTSASLEPMALREQPDFDLDQRIHDGDADYGQGERIQLRLRVGGYMLGVLRDCPLSEDQLIVEDETEESDGLAAVLTATVPSTGQLYRWLLGCGPHVEVLEPEGLRQVLRRSIAAMATRYA